MTGQNVLADRYGRRVSTLRISLTDLCNFRCVYCMPPEGVEQIETSRYLTLDQVARVVRLTGQLGVTRYRLTGGEPLLRPDIVGIVGRLKTIDTVSELSITTNGSLLPRLAAPLRSAGLSRLNISLDSLDPDRFNAVTRHRLYERVRAGIQAALDVGFPVKINVVVMKGMTVEEIVGFVNLAVDRALEVRFLEFMPLCGSGWETERVFPIGQVRAMVRERFALSAVPRDGHPAEVFTVKGTGARVGFIAPLSEPFCEDCSRIRITADGRIRPCLFSDTEHDLAPLLGWGASDEDLVAAIRSAVWAKPAGSQFKETPFAEDVEAEWSTQGPMIRGIGG